MVSPTTLSDVDSGSIVVAEVGDGSAFHRFIRNGKGLYLESLQPGGEMTAVEDPGSFTVIGRVAGFYRRMDDAGALNLTQH